MAYLLVKVVTIYLDVPYDLISILSTENEEKYSKLLRDFYNIRRSVSSLRTLG